MMDFATFIDDNDRTNERALVVLPGLRTAELREGTSL